MRIAFITFEYPPFMIGGAGVYAYNLTKELVKMGNEVVVFTPALDSPRTNEVDGPQIIEVKVNRRLPLISVQFWLNLPKALRTVHSINHFDIVHINGSSYWFIPGKIIDVPHVVTIHHLSRDAKGDVLLGKSTNIQLVGESNILYQYLESRCVKYADRIIAVSKFTRDRITEIYNISVDKIDVIYNGYTPLRTEICDDELINFKKKFNLDSRPIILFVGRIDDPRKGLDILLDAFSMVSKTIESQLLIVGQGDKNQVFNKARDLGIDADIIVTGFLNADDLACSYSICDIYVCPSIMEGFGLTLLEAQSYGKKIIAFDVGAISEVVNSSAILLKETNSEFLKKAIVDVLSDDDINRNLTNNVEENTWVKTAMATADVYENFK